MTMKEARVPIVVLDKLLSAFREDGYVVIDELVPESGMEASERGWNRTSKAL